MNIFQFKYSPIPKLALALLVFSLASFTKAAKSEIIVIDNFDVESPELTIDINTAFDSYGPHTSGTILGNTVTRDLSLTRVSVAGSRDEATFDSFEGRLAWSNDSRVESTAILNHHFSPINVLASHPLGSALGSLQLDLLSTDQAPEITITLVDANNQSAVLSKNPTGQQILEYAYDDFLASNSNLDLTQIKTVSLGLAGPAEVDLTLNRMLFNTPEPSSVMLFSLAGIGLASRRRRKRS